MFFLILIESLAIDNNQLHPRTELAKIYQYQKKHNEAEKILLELLSIDPKDFYAMAELISVYDKTNNPERCFELFDAFLRHTHVENRREPQAMFNNIFRLCLKYRRPDKAKEYFDNYSDVLDSRNISLFHRCFGFQKQI